MVRLQRQFNRRIDGKNYYKHVIVIPPKMVKANDLDPGDELIIRLKKKKENYSGGYR